MTSDNTDLSQFLGISIVPIDIAYASGDLPHHNESPSERKFTTVTVTGVLERRRAQCECEEYYSNRSCGHVWVAALVDQVLRRLDLAMMPTFALHFREA